MKNKSFGKVIATVLQFLLCIIIAFAIWLVVQYAEYNDTQEEAVKAIYAVTTALCVI